MTPSEFLALTRLPPAAPVPSARSYQALREGGNEAFLTLHTNAGRFESAGYGQLSYISGDDRGGTAIRLLFTKSVVTLQGRQLGAVFDAIRTRRAAHLYEFDGARYDPPEPGEPIITAIGFAAERAATKAGDAASSAPAKEPRE